MSGIDHLRALALGSRPSDNGLLENARGAWGASELIGEEAILAAFLTQPFHIEQDCLTVETASAAALVGRNGALVADLYQGRIGRFWRVEAGLSTPAEAAVDVAFDPDMRQERGDLLYRADDHIGTDPAAMEPLLAAGRELIRKVAAGGNLRVRGFVVRAMSDRNASAALLSLYTLSNGRSRSASFSFAIVGGRHGGDEVREVGSRAEPRPWTPRL